MANQIVGFDIGENQLKAVLLNGGRVKKTVCAVLPDNMIARGEIMSVDAMSDFIKQTVRELGVIKADAAVVLPSSQVFVRNVTVSPMSSSQLEYNLPFEFKDYLTEEKGKYIFDYAVTATNCDEDGEVKSIDLFACTALRSTIDTYRTLFRRAGLKLLYAVPNEYALTALTRTVEAELPDYFCVVDIGHAGTRIDIFHGSVHSQHRSLDFGLRQIDELISLQYKVDVHLAQNYKLSNFEDVLNGEQCRELYAELAIEVMKAVNFYNYNNREAVLENIYICGGGAAVPALCRAIAERTGMKIHSGAELLRGCESIDKPALFLSALGCTLGE